MMKRHSLAFNIWVNLSFLITIVLIFIWALQILFLNAYYEWVIKNDIKNIATYVKKYHKDENNIKLYDNLAYENNVCIEIVSNKIIQYSSEKTKGCLYNSKHTDYKNNFEKSNKNAKTFIIENPYLKNQTIIYAIKLDENASAYINASLEPIDKSIAILKQELLYVTIIVYIMSFIAEIYISKKVSEPITNISEFAKDITNGNYNCTIEHVSNIIEIDELAETLKMAKIELAKTDELRRDLMANVSHDLKTPLTMIKAYAEMSRDLTLDKEKTKENLNIIIEETDRLNTLVNDILELSKNEYSFKLDLENYDIVNQINNILKKLNYLVEKENYKFVFKNKKPIFINADQRKMEQVIYNLLINAINYTGKDKKVSIEIKNNNINYRVNIKDTGKGIDEKDLKFIWDKYYKNEKNHQRNKMGTGLGLNICKSILIRHNFNYGVISKKGKGTTFYIEMKKELEKN